MQKQKNEADKLICCVQLSRGLDCPLCGEMAVALGAAHVLAVAEDGALLAWGAGAHGQLGT